MASLLDTKLKSIVATAFKGQLLTGTLRRETPGGVDEYGDPESPTVTTYSFEGIRDTFNAYYLAIGSLTQAGIKATDVRILIIAGSLAVVPTQEDKIKIRGSWYQVRSIVEIDPAGATYTLAAYEITDPDA